MYYGYYEIVRLAMSRGANMAPDIAIGRFKPGVYAKLAVP
jgi:hypothetical protein